MDDRDIFQESSYVLEGMLSRLNLKPSRTKKEEKRIYISCLLDCILDMVFSHQDFQETP